MKVVCRGILLVITLAIVMVLTAVIYALAFFDPNDFKPRIVDTVRERTGLTLVMDGNISWRFYPHIGFSIDSVKAYAPDQLIMNGPQASIRHADISLSLSRLLMGDVIVDGLNAQGVRVNLLCDERRQQTCLTWLNGFKDVLASSMPAPPRPFLVETPRPMDGGPDFQKRSDDDNAMDMPPHGMPALRDDQNVHAPSWPRLIFDLNRIKIEDGEVHYQGLDGGLVQRLDINQLTLVGTRVALGRHFPVSVTFDVASGTRLPPATVTAQAEVCSNVLMGQHEIEHLRLAALSGNKRYSLSMAQLSADTGHQEYRLRDAHIDGMLRSLASDDNASPFSLSFDGRYDGLTDKAEVENVNFSHQGVDVQGRVEGLTLFNSPRWKGTLALATNNLRQWLTANAVKALPDDTRAFRQLTADIDFNVDAEHLSVDSIKGRLDGQPLNASVQWRYEDAPSFELEMPFLSLDRYLPPDSGAWSYIGSSSSARDMVAPEWVEWLRQHRGLLFKAHANIDALTWNNRSMHNLSLALSTQDGRWQLSRLSAMVGDGQVAMTGGVQVDQMPGRLFMNANVKDVPLYTGRLPNADVLEPSISGRMELGAQLNDPWGTLSGPVWLGVRNDDQSGAWLSHTVCRAVAQASNIPTGEVVPAMMETASGRFTLRDGILYSDDLHGRLAGNPVEGEGVFDLARHRFDYHLLVRSSSSALTGCTLPREMISNGVPLRCSGTLADMPDGWCGLDDERGGGILRNTLRHNDRWSTSP